MKRFKSKIITYLVAFYAILGGIAFLVIQTGKLLRPASADAGMASLPLGRFNWGFVWSDTLVAGPLLLLGGFLMLTPNHSALRLGNLLTFTGFTINLYAMICLWIGFYAIGHPMQGIELWSNIFLTFLGVLGMIHIGMQTIREAKNPSDKS
jgi:hypothetical protein